MPVPNIYETTTPVHGTGALSVPWGTHNSSFVAVMVVTSNGEDIDTPTQSGADGTWVLIDEAYVGTPGGAGSVGIAAFYCRATSGSMSNATVADTGDHTSARMFMLQNVVASGNPINFSDTQTVGSATSSISMAVPDSTVQNCRVFILAGCGFDQATNPGGSGWTNASLSSVGLAGQYCTDNGNGGGYMGGTGEKATAGSCGTFAHTWASGATLQANIVFAISDTATVQDSGAGASAGVATVAATGAAVFGGAGSSAGAATANATASAGPTGDAAGSSAVSGVGAATATAAGSAAGAASGAASSVEHRLIDVGATPQTIANGSWSVGAFEAKWKVQVTMTNASGHASYTGYHGIITSGTASGYGLWLNGSNFEVVDTDDNILGSFACTWSAGQSITLMPDFVNGTLTISGATTGSGVHNFTPSGPHWESGSALYVGGWGGNATWNLAATFGDIYAVVTAGRGLATGTSSAAAVGAGGDLDFQLGAVVSARLLFGSSQTSVTTAQVTTQESGSTIVICTGGLLTDLAAAPTDNKGNTYTALGSAEEFADWPGYGIRMWQCVGATGGSGHTFTQTQTQFQEVTIVVVEISDAEWIEDHAIVERADGSSVVSPSVTTLAEAHVVVFWSGDAPTGQTASLTPNNGFAVEDEATLVDHPNGYVPIAAIHAYKSAAGTYSTTIGQTPTQGAIIGAVAIQRAQIAAGAGGAGGVGSAAAVGASSAVSPGAAAGAGAASAIGAASVNAAGTSAGTATAGAAGLAVGDGAGAADGVGTAAGIGVSSAAAAGASAGAGVAAAIGGATSAGAGASAAAAASAGVGTSTAVAAGTAAGSANVAGVGDELADSEGTGAAAAASSAIATGAAIAIGAGAGMGAALAVGAGASTGRGAGLAAAAGSTSAAGESTARSSAAAAGTASATGTGSALSGDAGVGGCAGASTATGVGVALVTADLEDLPVSAALAVAGTPLRIVETGGRSLTVQDAALRIVEE